MEQEEELKINEVEASFPILPQDEEHTEQHKESSCDIILVDFYNDTNKSGMIFPFVLVLLLLLLSFYIYPLGTGSSQSKKATIDLEMFFDYKMFPLGDASIPVLVLRTSDRAELANITARIVIESFKGHTSKKYFDFTCDDTVRGLLKETLHDIRTFNACMIELDGDVEKPDYYGRLDFSRFRFVYGPEGMYTARIVLNNGQRTDTFSFTKRRTVYDIRVKNNPPENATCGVPLNVQPLLQLRDVEMKPIVGKRVVALSWVEPLPIYQDTLSHNQNHQSNAYTYGKNYSISANKYAFLVNDISEPSDENGIVTFNNLTILGSTYKYVWILFAVDGVIRGSWQTHPILYYHVPTKHSPILINDATSYKVTIENALPTKIKEGELFRSVIHVANSKGEPVESVLCVATLHSQNGEIFPAGYRPGLAYIMKRLIRPIPGKYGQGKALVTPTLTNKDGTVEFEGLGFSISGIIDNGYEDTYGLYFQCGFARSEVVHVNVTSSVGKVEVLTDIEDLFLKEGEQYVTRMVIKVTDDAGNPIKGKFPNYLKYLDEKNQTNYLLNFYLNQYPTAADTTDDLGVALVEAIVCLARDSHGRLAVYVDDKVGYTTILHTYAVSSLRKPVFNYATLWSTNHIFLKPGEESVVEIDLINSEGGSYEGEEIPLYLKLFPLTDTMTPVPEFALFTMEKKFEGKSRTAIILKVAHAIPGTYYLFIGILGLDETYFSSPEMIKVTFFEPEHHVELLGKPNRQINYSKWDTISLRITDENGDLVRNKLFDVNLVNIYNPPSTYHRSLRESTLLENAQVTTNTEGVLVANYSFVFPGTYSFTILLNNSESTPLVISTDLPVTEVKILLEPNPTINYTVTEAMLNPFVVLVNATVKGRYVVVATLIPESENDLGGLDFYSGSDTEEDSVLRYYTLYSHKFEETIDIAILEWLTVEDVKLFGCFRFRFYVGDPDTNVKSALSSRFCFANKITGTFMPSLHSNKLLPFSGSTLVPYALVRGMWLLLHNFFDMQLFIDSINKHPVSKEHSLAYAENFFGNNKCRVGFNGLIGPHERSMVCKVSTSFSIDPACTLFDFNKVFAKLPTDFAEVGFHICPKLAPDCAYEPTSLWISNRPEQFDLLLPFPDHLYVGQVFVASVKLSTFSKERARQALYNAFVQCELVPSIEHNRDNKDLKMLLTNIGSSYKLKPDNIVKIKYRGFLDEDYSYSYTNEEGIANLKLKVTSGKPGKYEVICYSADVQSHFLAPIQLHNTITRLALNASQQNFEVHFTSGSTSIKLDPIVINVEGSYDNLEDLFHVQIVESTYLQKAFAVMMDEKEDVSNMTMFDVLLGNLNNNLKTEKEKLSRLWDLLSKGSKAFELHNDICKCKVNSGKPKKLSDGKYLFDSIEIDFEEPGDYFLSLEVKGIESGFNLKMSIKEAGKTRLLAYFLQIDILVLTIACIAALIANMSSPSLHPYWMVLPILLLIAGLILFSMSNHSCAEYIFAIASIIILIGCCSFVIYSHCRKLTLRTQFPQRLIAGIICGFYTMIYVALSLVPGVLGMIDKLYSVANSIEISLNGMVKDSKESVIRLFGYEITHEDVVSTSSDWRYTLNDIASMILLIRVCFIIAAVMVGLGYIASFCWSLYDFKKRDTRDLPQTKAVSAIYFPVLVIINTIVGFIVNVAWITVLFAVLGNAHLWRLIYEHIWALVLVVLAFVGSLMLNKFLNTVFFTENSAKKERHKYLQFAEIALLFVKFFAGFVSAFFRLIIGQVFLYISLIRFTDPILPPWIVKKKNLDDINNSYNAVVAMHKKQVKTD